MIAIHCDFGIRNLGYDYTHCAIISFSLKLRAGGVMDSTS